MPSAEQSAKETQNSKAVVASLYQWHNACFYANKKRSKLELDQKEIKTRYNRNTSSRISVSEMSHSGH